MAGEESQAQGGQEQSQGNQNDNDSQKSQAGGSGQGNPTNQADDKGQDPETFNKEYVQKLRSEAASWRTKHSNLEKRLSDLEGKDLSEADKLKRELEQTSQQNKELAARIRNADITTAA